MSLFTPDDPGNTTRLFRFLHEVNEKHSLGLASYQDLYQWSVSDNDLFWSHVWDHTGIVGDKGKHVVDSAASPAENPAWFSDSTVNFSENLLSNRSPDTTAIVQVCTFSSDVCLNLLAISFAPSRANFPEPQPSARPHLQCTALLTRGRRGFGAAPVGSCSGRQNCVIHFQPRCKLTLPVPDLIRPAPFHLRRIQSTILSLIEEI